MPRTFSLALLVVLLSSALVFAQFRTVTVQNANGNPVPTTIQNTPTVNVNGTVPVSGTVSATITGTPSVNATITGTPSVSVTGTPTVNVNGTVPVSGTVNAAIINTPAVNVNGTVPVTGNVGITGTPSVSATITGTPSVSVTGTPTVSVTNLPTGTAGPAPTTCVLVKSLDNPAQQPFQTTLNCSTTPGSFLTSCGTSFLVPAGKELVIEYVQVRSQENSGSSTENYELQAQAGGQLATYFFATGTRILPSVPIGEHLTRIYADPGSVVAFIGFENNNTGSVSFFAVLSGYLVNVP